MSKRELQGETSIGPSGNFFNRNLPGRALSLRRVGFSAAMFMGAGLLVATSAIHSNLWTESYRFIPTIGNLFVAQLLAGVVLALGVVFYRRPLMAVAGIGFMAATIAGLVVSAEYGLFGFKESLSSPFVRLTLNIEVAGIVAFAAALAVAANASLAAASTTGSTSAGTEPVSPQQAEVPQPVLEVPAPPSEHVAVAPQPQSPPASERLVWRPGSVFSTAETPQEVRAQAVDVPVELPTPSTIQAVSEPVTAAAGPTPLGGQFEVNERAVFERERVLGVDHPATLMSLINLAYMYRSAGRIEEALAVQERIAEDSRRIHGPKHPYTVTSNVNLAQLRTAMRRSKKGKRQPVAV